MKHNLYGETENFRSLQVNNSFTNRPPQVKLKQKRAMLFSAHTRATPNAMTTQKTNTTLTQSLASFNFNPGKKMK